MSYLKDKVVKKETFLSSSGFAKEQYEGLLVASDTDSGLYNIGIQINDDEVLVVDNATEHNVRERIQNWAAQIQDVQKKYGQYDDLSKYPLRGTVE